MVDPFEVARAERENRNDLKRARVLEQKNSIIRLYNALLDHKEQMHANGVRFQIGRFLEYPDEYAILLYQRQSSSSEIGDLNAVFFNNKYGAGNFVAEGTVFEKSDWDEESHQFRNHYCDCDLGATVDEAIATIARYVVENRLPATGSFDGRGRSNWTPLNTATK